MAFTSAAFLVFVAAAVLCYRLVSVRFRWVVLLADSYIFYGFFSVKAMIFLVFTTAVTYFCALFLKPADTKGLSREDAAKLKRSTKKRVRRVLAFALAVVFGVLFMLKYYNFLADNLVSLTSRLGIGNPPRLELLLPLGISFYIFQSAGYLIDVYRGKVKAEKNPLKLALFVSFFPQIVQGPIGRFERLAPQLFAGKSPSGEDLRGGIMLMLWGFFKKMLIADGLAFFVDGVFGGYQNLGGAVIFSGVVGYCFQVYGDFSGGIDITRGAAQMFGIELDENFSRPYFAGSVQEFWKRWHITLGEWMRDYVFYPLSLSGGFSRLGRFSRNVFKGRAGKVIPAALASFVVFMLIGIWHGASWKYIAFGLYNAVIITFSQLCEPTLQSLHARLGTRVDSWQWRIFSVPRTFFLMTVGRYFSRGASLTAALAMLKITFSSPRFYELFDGTLVRLAGDVLPSIFALLALLCVSVLQERGVKIRAALWEKPAALQFLVILSLLSALVFFGIYREGYIATQFIYAQF